MRVVGKQLGVEAWRKHYQAMASGESVRKQGKVKRGRGGGYLYYINSDQSGGSEKMPIKLISPAQASVAQAKKMVHLKASKKKTSRKRKREPKRKQRVQGRKKRKRLIEDIFV